MPWWLALLNSSLGIVSAVFGVVTVIRPQALAPAGHGGREGRFYPAMYAARGIPLGLLVAVVVLAVSAAAQLGDTAIGVTYRLPGMVVFPLAVALVHLVSVVCLL